MGLHVKHWKRTLQLILLESALIYGCGIAALYWRFGKEASSIFWEKYGWAKLLLTLVFTQSAFYLLDLYDFGLIRRLSIHMLRIFQSLGAAAIALSLVFYVLPQTWMGRGVVVFHFALVLAVMTCWRMLLRWIMRHSRFSERVVILGTDQHAIELAREMLNRREAGYEVVGFIGTDPALVGQSLINPCVIGVLDNMESLALQYNADRIIISQSEQLGELPVDPLLNLKWRDHVAIDEWAPFYERLTGKISTAQLQPNQLIFANNMRWARFYRSCRRLADLVIASVGFVLTLPLMVLTAIAIKLESKGPLFYTQERVGLHNQPFRIIKFRSMRTDAEKNGAMWAVKNDPRVTRIGRFIRKTRIDELPQFINVLKGEMSMVGPRPERPEFVRELEQVIPYYSQRHLAKPGVTGWAQVRYPYGASIEDARMKHQYDLYYIKNQTPLLDVVVLLETLRVVFFGRFGR